MKRRRWRRRKPPASRLARSSLNLAEAALREGNGPEVQIALNDVPEDLRDSTWNNLLTQSDASIARMRTSTAQFRGVAADPRRPGVFAVAHHLWMVSVHCLRTPRGPAAGMQTSPQGSLDRWHTCASDPAAQAMAKTCGGRNAKISAATDGRGLPVHLLLIEGHAYGRRWHIESFFSGSSA